MDARRAHELILRVAADKANSAWRELSPTVFRVWVEGEVFRPDMTRGLSLSVDESVTWYMNPTEITELHKMGKQAIKEAIQENGNVFVGAIFAEAKEGRNYFNFF
jgi:hypothetical protein